ncbi:LysM peptidoglycan-binding domain-containing protein [Patescibacteria group bacterium]
MVLGVLVIVVVGVLIVNYFRSSAGDTSDKATSTVAEIGSVTHIVKEGDDLWKIAKEYYSDGLRWVEIAEINDIADPNLLESGQKLIIPNIREQIAEAKSKITNDDSQQYENELEVEEEKIEEDPANTPAATATNTPAPTTTNTPVPSSELSTTTQSEKVEEMKLEGDMYEVRHGDHLWAIAEKVYGDGLRWVDIASANKLDNPNIIHAGNKLVLPE